MFSILYIFKYISTCEFVHLNYINFIYEKAYRFSDHETMRLTKYFSSNKNDFCLSSNTKIFWWHQSSKPEKQAEAFWKQSAVAFTISQEQFGKIL